MSSLWWKIYECDSDFDKCGASHQLYLWFKICTYAYRAPARYIRAPLNIRETTISLSFLPMHVTLHSLKKRSTNLGNNVAHSKYAGFNGRPPFNWDHYRSRQFCPIIIILSVLNMFTLIRIEGPLYVVVKTKVEGPLQAKVIV
uniref:Uncharacterized protein n=1 Tax=Glossina austeni TaxID=7395 RepID=A0A1A9V541_GLOAU